MMSSSLSLQFYYNGISANCTIMISKRSTSSWLINPVDGQYNTAITIIAKPIFG